MSNTNDPNAVDNQSAEQTAQAENKPPLMGYITLLIGFLILSGALTSAPGWLQAFDFNSLSGDYGTMKNAAKNTFLGSAGTGAKHGFLFALSLAPGVILSVGIMNIIEQTGGLRVAQKLITPILRPLMGLPGCSSLAIIASMQSTDAGASLTKVLHENKEITTRERLIFTQYELSGSAAIGNYITLAAATFAFLVVPMGIPLAIILIMKMVGANITRFILNKFYTEEELESAE